MKVIGLTGIFGSGKSAVAGFMKDMGATVIDADSVVRSLYKPDSEAWRRVVALFGAGILTSSREIDRQKLGAIVFKDKSALQKLNNAVHPLVKQRVKNLLDEYRRKQVPVVVIEAALLFEAGWGDLVNETWVTTAPREVIFRRLNTKLGLPCSEVMARIHRQMPVREQVKRATRVINTDTSLDRLRTKVQRLWRELVAA